MQNRIYHHETQKRIDEARKLLFGTEKPESSTEAITPVVNRVSNHRPPVQNIGQNKESVVRYLDREPAALTKEFWSQISPSRLSEIADIIGNVIAQRRAKVRISEIEKELARLKDKDTEHHR